MMRKLFCLVACLAMVPVAAGAQTLDARPERPTYQMDIMHPSYDGYDTKIFSGAYLMSGRIPVGSSNAINFEVPFSYLSESNELVEDNTSSSIGNPLIGMTMGGEGDREIEFGMRMSLADDTEFSNLYATFADLSRWEAFVPSLWTLYGQVRWQRTTNGLIWEVNAGPNLWLPEDGGDTEMWATYGAGVGYAGPAYRLAVRSKGRMWLTQEGLNFDERTSHQVGLFADFGRSNWRPGMQLLLPVDRNSDNESTWGVSLKYTMD
jgi:hypothetical protein